MDPTVFIPHLPTRQNPINGDWVPTISLNPAAKLGELKVICDHPSDAAPEHFLQSQIRIAQAMRNVLAEDYIIIAGDPVLCALAIHEALHANGGVKVLRWNREARAYDLLIIED